MSQVSAVLALAQRDLLKLVRDRGRLVSGFVFPFIFIAFLGGTLSASFGGALGYDFVTFTFTGVLAQTIYQSAALGLVSLIEDRENDFSQEMFVSPISRYTIIFGKILGETLVALPQGLGILAFGLVLGVPLNPASVLGLVLSSFVVALFGGAFGVLVLSNLRSQRVANQIFPFVFLPQFFTAGVFTPLQGLPWYLDLLSRISPMRYAVDFQRGIFYGGRPEYGRVVLADPLFNFGVMAAAFVIFMAIGTTLFVRAERNR
ncbi:MAG: hypothetical protein FJ034_05045 [Chloroflexi bacterium]|nr:hypothetical protein [Chloroflexota bacterium]